MDYLQYNITLIISSDVTTISSHIWHSNKSAIHVAGMLPSHL